MSKQLAQQFLFNTRPIRVFDLNGNPWFVASDIAKCLGLSNPSKAMSALRSSEYTRIKAPHGGAILIVSESGMYTMILRSDSAIKEGTQAFNFRVWVTEELLPSIRKTGSYTMPSDTIDVTQQYLVRTAVSRLAKNSSLAYQRVYHELYERFKVPRYQELKKTDFANVMKFLQASDLLDGMDEPVTPPPQDSGAVLSKDEMKLIQTAVYLRSYLFKPIEDAFYHFLVSAKSPLAPRAWECFHDLNFQLLEPVLDKHGYSVKELPQYKHLVLNR